MATPIKATPTLTGKDARNFLRQLEENKRKGPDPERLEQIRKDTELFKKIFIFKEKEEE